MTSLDPPSKIRAPTLFSPFLESQNQVSMLMEPKKDESYDFIREEPKEKKNDVKILFVTIPECNNDVAMTTPTSTLWPHI